VVSKSRNVAFVDGLTIGWLLLLYDIFRTMFGVNADNLNQIFEITLSVSANVVSLSRD
jgi:hypothetical protein